MNTLLSPGSPSGAAVRRIGIMSDDLAIYKDVATGSVYVLAWRDHQGVALRDLDSEPGDPGGVIVVSEWELWEAIQAGRWQRYTI